MVRAGMVKHPSEWTWSGYHDIQQPKSRYRLIDHEALRELLHVDSNTDLAYPVSNRRIADVVGAEDRRPAAPRSGAIAFAAAGFLDRAGVGSG